MSVETQGFDTLLFDLYTIKRMLIHISALVPHYLASLISMILKSSSNYRVEHSDTVLSCRIRLLRVKFFLYMQKIFYQIKGDVQIECNIEAKLNNTRNSGLLVVPKRSSNLADKGFETAAPILFNKLPVEIRNAIGLFKNSGFEKTAVTVFIFEKNSYFCCFLCYFPIRVKKRSYC
jgi:hypothetical protein